VCFAPPVARLNSARKSSVRLDALDRSYFNAAERGPVENNYLVTAGAPRTDHGFFGLVARFSRVLTWLGWRRPSVRWRASHQTLPAVGLFKPAARSLRSRTTATSGMRMNTPTQFVPSRCAIALPLFSCQHQSMAQSAQLRVAIRRAQEVRPNPSIERTATGLAREAPQVIVPLRGPIR
jgi:hypothetical protein